MSETINIVEEIDDVDAIIRKNNYKLTADKIKQILSKVLNDPSQSAKRWVWELMQNAKDVKNKFDKVSIEIELSENELVFRHNGNPFKMSNITGLIQQVSSKDSANSDEEVTGKFGTGFIATHLLSDIIDIKGIVLHKDTYRDFEISLDRSGRTSEDLLPKIEAALDKIRKIDTDQSFTVRDNYETFRVESDYDTSFSYPLVNDEKRKAAKDGIVDLVNTLPLTLVNISKIKEVKIIDRINSEETEYKKEEIYNDGVIRKTHIKLSKAENRSFITYYTEELSLSVEVNNFEELCLIEHFGKTPNLYRDFPLIGSDKFYFPYILNGYKLNPTEDRDGIPIHSESAPEHIENRLLIEKAFSVAKLFTDYLISQNAKNLFVCAFSRMPNEKWQEASKEWYKNLQIDYRAFIKDKTIVELETVSEVNVTLNSAFVPVFGDTDQDRLAFYDILKPFIGSNNVPKRDLLSKWLQATGPKEELESWDRNLRYTLGDLLNQLQEIGNIETLNNKLESNVDALSWLNNLYQFIIYYKATDALADFAIIPNQNGDFQKLTKDTLHLEDVNENIPDEFLDILSALGDNWRVKLIHRDVNLPGLNIETKGLPLVSNRINELIIKDEFKKNPNSFSIIKDILRNVTSLENTENFRCEIYLKGKELFGFREEIRVVSNIKDFRFKIAQDIFIEKMHDEIQRCATIDVLSTQLKVNIEDSVTWLNIYLNKIRNSKEYSNHITYGNIVPNRKGVFKGYEEIHNFGTVETPLDTDLIDLLFKLDSKQDWNDKLVLEGIDIGCPPITFEELGSAVDFSIREIEKEEAVNIGYINDFKESIIELIDWCNSNNELAKYLSHFMQRKNDLWVKFSMTDKIFSLFKDKEAIEMLEAIQESGITKEDLNKLIALFPNGIPKNVMDYAKEDARKKKEFSNLLEVGSKVEQLFIKTLEQFKISSERDKIIHAGGGSYDIRVFNPDTNKSFYIELKSCKYQNTEPINIAVSQAKRAVKELANENFAFVIIERSANNDMDEEYIKNNTKYFKNPGAHLSDIGINYDKIKQSSNTENSVDLKMENAEFKGSLDYKWTLNQIGKLGFNELLMDINKILSNKN